MTGLPPPPPLETLPAGHRLPAGLSYSTVIPDLDFETYSEAGFEWDEGANKWRAPPGSKLKGLPTVGAAPYAEHPTCEVLCLYYDLKDGRGRRQWRPGQPPPADLFSHVQAGGLLEAWNVGFERWIWENVCQPMGWPLVPAQQWRCAMAKARAHSMPGKLAEFGRVADLSVQKDADGKRLLDKFSVPRNPTQFDSRRRLRPLWTPEDAGRELAAVLTPGQTPAKRLLASESVNAQHLDTLKLAAYCEVDIISEAEASSITPDLSPAELRFWQDDQAINHRGVQIDLAGVHDCISIIEQASKRYGEELEALAGCKPTELQQLKGWLHAQGVHLDSMDQEAIEEALTRSLPPQARRALELRAAVGSASVKKVYAMRNRITRAGRLHDSYNYHGARTGRPTGEGVQSTNLPKAGPMNYRCGFNLRDEPLPGGGCGKFHGSHTMWCHWCHRATLRGPKDAREWSPAAAEDALHAISFRSLDYLQLLFGDALLAVAGVLRGLFVAAPGHDLVSSDFTAIEGVVIAAMAGEAWRLDAFRAGRSLYVESASRAFNIPTEEFDKFRADTGQHHPMRQVGKCMELGLGFGGWINALRQFDVTGEDDELKSYVLAWRAASPAIEHLWGGQRGGPGKRRWDTNYFGLEGMAVMAVLNPGTKYEVQRLDGEPTGIAYLVRGDALYCRVPSGGLITYHRPRLTPAADEWRGWALSFEGWNSNPKSGPMGWQRMGTYSGKLAENVTQKVARDKQMGALSRCEDAGYPVVMHTYDEIVAEVPEGVGSVEQLEALMTRPDSWNETWPIQAAGGWRAKRYRKG